jgi:hypothetical protein
VIAKLGYPIKLGKQAKVNSLSEISEVSFEQSGDGTIRSHVGEGDVDEKQEFYESDFN